MKFKDGSSYFAFIFHIHHFPYLLPLVPPSSSSHLLMLFCLKFSWNQTGGRLKQDCCRIKRKYPSLEMWDLKFEFQTPNKKSNPRKNLKKNCEVSGKFQIPPLRRKKFVIYTTTVLLQSPTSFGSAECSKKNTHPLILWEDGVLCPSEK